MKIMHITDIHGDLETLEKTVDYAREDESIKVLACTGDYLGIFLKDNESDIMFSSYNMIKSQVRTKDGGQVPFKDAIEYVLSSTNTNRDLKIAGEVYSSIEKLFDEKATEQYSLVNKILTQSKKAIVMVHGNWDSPQYFDHFTANNIHGRTLEIEGVKFAGYGGENTEPIFVPPTRFIGLDEKGLHDFLIREDADVVLTHVPPKGLVDIVPIRKDKNLHIGSWASLAYLRAQSPNVIFCGHAHDAIGLMKDDYAPTLVINSGNLGRYPQTKHHGTFSINELNDKKYLKTHSLFKLYEGKFELIKQINLDDN